MVIPRIVAGRALLDKLPFWIAVPMGLVIGLVVGYWVAEPTLDQSDLTWAIIAVASVLWLGFSTPRPVPPLASTPDTPAAPARQTSAPIPDSQEW